MINKIVCKHCGSGDISTLQYVGVNDGKYIGDGPGGVDDNWCESCQGHVEFMTFDDWVKQHLLDMEEEEEGDNDLL